MALGTNGAFVVAHAATLLPAYLLLTATAVLCAIFSFSWIWDHRAAGMRRGVQLLNALAEEVLRTGSIAAIYQRLSGVLAEFSGATHVHLYLYNRRTQCLEHPEGLSIDPESPPAGLAMGVALAFRNRTLFNIADTRRNAVLVPGFEGPRSVLFVPMITEGEVRGVFEVDHALGVRHFSPEERTALQHLGNVIAAALKQQDQADRMPPTGVWIKAVASELRAPLDSISHAASRLLASDDDPNRLADLRLVAEETARATEVAARLISFGRAEPASSKILEVNSLVRRRERQWKSLGIEGQARTSATLLAVNGPETQLEQLLLSIFAHAERGALQSPERKLSITTAASGRRASIDITYSQPEDTAPPDAELSTWQGVVARSGGQMRFSRPGARLSRFEIELPLAGVPARTNVRQKRHSKTLTMLVVEPDATSQKKLLKDLSKNGHRAVPLGTAEEGIDLAQRMRFDAILCSTRLPGLNWVEFFERVRDLAGVFVVLVDGFDPDGPWLEPADGLVLNRSAYEMDFERVLREVEAAADHERAHA